ncbi:MAG: hypothetical protein FJZ43_01245 [Candidatus Staskawiczbacteria bacterium]|nr:hypothetical protein [Candidatus Staskawiczbacteria bacterium]
MAWYFVVFLFLLSCFVLSWVGSRLIKSLINIGRFLQWKEFVITFFVMAFATSLSNFFVDFNAASRGLPEIALGDIIGGNLIDLTLILAIAIFFTKKGISAESHMVQRSAIFTTAIAILPLFLIADSKLERIDGVILIFAFLFYVWWVFSEKSRFRKTYNGKPKDINYNFNNFVIDVFKMILFAILLLMASFFVVDAAKFFAESLGMSLALVGILIISLGNTFPEMYFSIVSARKKENWMVLGELMGSVIICSTLVLGLIAIFFPFEIHDLSVFLTARVFLIIAALFSLLFVITEKKITKKEGFFLLFIYIAFLITEIFISR